MRFASEAELAGWYARGLTLGSVLVPMTGPAELDEEFPLRVEVEGAGSYTATAQVLEILEAENPPSLRVQLRAEPDLRDFIDRYALKRREGRLAERRGGRRLHDRFDTFLNVRLAGYRQLGEYASSIGRGGLFVRSPSPPPVGSAIQLTIRLPNEETFEVSGKVVRVISAELGAATGQAPGAGVAFEQLDPAMAARIEQLLEAYRARPSRVLLVDEDLSFLKVLAELLRRSGMSVDAARNGRTALHTLLEYLFEIDGVVFDLNLHEIDGFALFERLKRMGNTFDLRLVVLSEAEEQVLRELLDSGVVDDAISKRLPPAEAAGRIHELLTRRGKAP